MSVAGRNLSPVQALFPCGDFDGALSPSLCDVKMFHVAVVRIYTVWLLRLFSLPVLRPVCAASSSSSSTTIHPSTLGPFPPTIPYRSCARAPAVVHVV